MKFCSLCWFWESSTYIMHALVTSFLLSNMDTVVASQMSICISGKGISLLILPFSSLKDVFCMALFLSRLLSCIRCIAESCWHGGREEVTELMCSCEKVLEMYKKCEYTHKKRKKLSLFLGWLDAIYLPVILEIRPYEKKSLLSRTLNNEEFQRVEARKFWLVWQCISVQV